MAAAIVFTPNQGQTHHSGMDVTEISGLDSRIRSVVGTSCTLSSTSVSGGTVNISVSGGSVSTSVSGGELDDGSVSGSTLDDGSISC